MLLYLLSFDLSLDHAGCLFITPQHGFDEMRLRHLADVHRSESAEMADIISLAFARNDRNE